MTRVDALYKSIELVKNSNLDETTQEEMIEQLENCIRKYRGQKWSQENIFKACDKIIEERGALLSSYVSGGYEGYPSAAAIRQAFGMPFREFREKYYPMTTDVSAMSRYKNKTVAEWTEDFIEQYKSYYPCGQDEYNRRRRKDSPTWITIARMHGLETWSGLLANLQLKKLYDEPDLEYISTYKTQVQLEQLDRQVEDRR